MSETCRCHLKTCCRRLFASGLEKIVIYSVTQLCQKPRDLCQRFIHVKDTIGFPIIPNRGVLCEKPVFTPFHDIEGAAGLVVVDGIRGLSGNPACI